MTRIGLIKKLKAERRELLDKLGIGKKTFFKQLPRMNGRGYIWHISDPYGDDRRGGHKASLKQQVMFLHHAVEVGEEMNKALQKAKEDAMNKEKEKTFKLGEK